MFRLALCYALTLAIAGCSSKKTDKAEPQKVQKEVEPPAKEKLAPKPKLVLVVVLDQLPSNAMLRYAPHLPKEGVLRQAIEGGVFHERVRYQFAGTNTAPGHASIFTGELPADHGIDSNDIYNYEAKARMRIINDGEHAIHGVADAFAAPARLLKPTVGDKLHEQSPDSKVVSVSLKGRAAVVSGGKTPNLVTWYSPKLPGFTTSSFYEDEMPAWLSEWNANNPVSERYAVWTPRDAKLYEEVNGLDEAPGEADWHGLGTSFPHEVAKTAKPEKVFLATPQSVPYLLDMARLLVERYELGDDANPDLLALSISSTDYAGHTFGVDSWEYLDVLIKTDIALAAFVKELEASTDLAVIVTSDHGGTSLAETSLAQGKPGGRLYADTLVNTLEAKADKALGKGNWILAYIQPYLYLHEDALDSEKRSDLLALISAHADGDDSVEAIYAPEDAHTWRGDDNWLRQDVANSVAASTKALFVVPAEGYVASPSKGILGTGHGTPWPSDREVPFFAWGTGVGTAPSSEVFPQDRVAATIAALLGLKWHLPAKPLPGVQ